MFWKQFSLRRLVKLIFAIYMIYEHTVLFTHAWLLSIILSITYESSLISILQCSLSEYLHVLTTLHMN